MTEVISELRNGGVIMIPLLLASVLALAIVLERAFALRRGKVVIGEIAESIRRIETEEDVRVLERICQSHPGPFSSVVIAALDNRGLPPEDLREVILDQGRQEVRVLERGLVMLETIASASPLLGLMGTVLGMIKVFDVISQQGLGQASVLSGGISEALITTVTGLAIGIPALVAYNFFTGKAESLIMDIEKYSTLLLHKVRSLTRDEGEDLAV